MIRTFLAAAAATVAISTGASAAVIDVEAMLKSFS